MPSRVVWILIGCLAPACSDTASTSGEDAGAESTTDGVGPGSGASDPDTSGGTNADTSEPGADEGSSEGTGADSLTPCGDLDCGSGSCESDPDGQPRCLCPEGDVAAGLQCLRCAAVEDSYDIELGSSDVTVSLLLGGASPPIAPTETATLWLRNPATDELVLLGDTHAPLLRTRVLPLAYEVIYSRVAGSAIPANRRAVVGYLDAKAAPDVALDLDLEPVLFTGEFLFDGALAPDIGSENGRVWLRNPGTGDEVYLGVTRTQAFSTYVLPGEYTIEFESIAGAEVAPRNRRGRVGTIVVPDGAGAHAESIDITTVLVSGAFLVDGAPAPQIASERGAVSLRDRTTGDEFPIGSTDTGSYQVRVLPSDYDIVYARVTGSEVMPANTHGVVGKLEAAGSTSLDIDIATTTVAGAFTIAGAPPPVDGNDDGRISLQNLETGDRVDLGNTTAGSFQRIVLAGAYTIHYAQDTSSAIAPANTNAQIGSIDAVGAPAFDIDVPTAFVSGTITIGQGAPPSSDYDDGWVSLRNQETGDTVLLANTRMGMFGATVVPGTYEVVYAVETPGGQVPINLDSVVLATVVVAGGVEVAVDIDIPVRALGGTIGATGGPGERASVYLQAIGQPLRSLLGNSADGLYGQPVIPGRYLVSYGVDTATGGLPMNTDAPVACIDVKGP